MIAQTGKPFNFSYVDIDFTDDLFVRAFVQDNSDGFPGTTVETIDLEYTQLGAYEGAFTPSPNKKYSINIAVYTDDTFETIDTSKPPVTYDVEGVNLGSNLNGQILGFVKCENSNESNDFPFEISIGDVKVMNLKVMYAENFDPVDLSGCTEIDVYLPLLDGTIAHRLLSLGQVTVTGSPLLGKFTVPIPKIISDLLNPGTFQRMDVVFTISGTVFTVRYQISIFERS